MKKLVHDGCSGEVVRRTLTCKRCGIRPSADRLTLHKDPKVKAPPPLAWRPAW